MVERHGADCIVPSVTRAALLAIFILQLLAPGIALAQEAIYVVRHAERLDQSPDSLLSPEAVGAVAEAARSSA